MVPIGPDWLMPALQGPELKGCAGAELPIKYAYRVAGRRADRGPRVAAMHATSGIIGGQALSPVEPALGWLRGPVSGSPDFLSAHSRFGIGGIPKPYLNRPWYWQRFQENASGERAGVDCGGVKGLDGKLVVVTGGGSGIGAACARLYSGRGARVVVADRDIGAAEHVAHEISGSAMLVDVGDPASIAALADRVQTDQGSVDGVLTSAGVLSAGVRRLEDWDGDWDRFFEINVRGTFLTARAFGTRMASRGRGSIVTIGSVTGHRSTPLHAYGTSKAAVSALTRNLAAEWGRSGVRVNCISPGYVLTPALKQSIDGGHRDMSAIAESSALGRVADPVEVARVSAFLLSDESSAVTGIDLPVDAGWLLTGSWMFYGGLPPSRSVPSDA